MTDWIRVAGEDEFGEKVRMLHHQSERIAVFRLSDGFYAIADRCSHADGFLSEGEVDGEVVECPSHGARFDIRTGKNLCFPAVTPVRSYPVKIQDGAVYVEVDSARR